MKNLLFLMMWVMFLQSSAQSFKTSTQKGVDLKQYKTFSVEKGAIVSTREIDEGAFYEEFKTFVARELGARGYLFVSDSAEVSVTYIVETTVKMETEDLGPLGGTPVDNAALVDQPQRWSREFTRGTLIIEMVDVARKNAVWSATGTMDVTRAKGVKLLDRCVRKAFKKFPKSQKKADQLSAFF